MRETDTHIFFWGTWFSNWAIGNFVVEGKTYNCTEQFMMAQKALIFKDTDSYTKIMKSTSPREQKSLGRKVKNYDDNVWNKVRFDIVVKANLEKFKQIKEANLFLKKTGNKILVEASPYDRIWGIGLHYKDDKVLNLKNWRGMNLLGEALMDVRLKIFGDNNV